MSESWCPNCCTEHPLQGTCPGALEASGPELRDWRITVETPDGPLAFGVLLARSGERYRARILTFPRMLWTIPGGRASMKFVGRTEGEARNRAVDFIRKHCRDRAYVMRDELDLAADEAALPFSVSSEAAAGAERRMPASPTAEGPAVRVPRRLPVTFGRNRPTLSAYTTNLSESGIFVATRRPFTAGENVGMLLELEHLKVPLRGSVVWHRPKEEPPSRPPGMGMRLLNPPPVYVRYIEALS